MTRTAQASLPSEDRSKALKKRFTIAILILVLTSFVLAGEGFNEEGKNVKQELKEMGKSTGKGMKKAGKSLGKGFKRAGKKTGRTFKKLGKKTGKDFKKAGKTIRGKIRKHRKGK